MSLSLDLEKSITQLSFTQVERFSFALTITAFMKNFTALSKKAIQAAKNKDWDQAVDINLSILEEDDQNIDALNRLALAYMQQSHPRLARQALKQVLDIDKHNKIAQKNLKKVRDKQPSQIDFNQNQFIEEPGKAKNIELVRVSTDDELTDVGVGQSCQLDPKNEYVSVSTTQGQYLGLIPQHVSQRLIQLIDSGNSYETTVKVCKPEKCVIHVKEKAVSAQNSGITSFPTSPGDRSYSSKMIDEYKVEDNVPLDIVDTDTDEETMERSFNNL